MGVWRQEGLQADMTSTKDRLADSQQRKMQVRGEHGAHAHATCFSSAKTLSYVHTGRESSGEASVTLHPESPPVCTLSCPRALVPFPPLFAGR